MSDVRKMSDAKLAARLKLLEHEWDDLDAALEESGGCAGSPMESLSDQLQEVYAEQKRRANPPAQVGERT